MLLTPMLRLLSVEDPDRTAIVAAGACLSYRELYAQASAISAVLDAIAARGSAASDPSAHERPTVAISTASAFEVAVMTVAAEAGDRILTVIDAAWPVALRVRMIEASGASVVVTDQHELAAALGTSGWRGIILEIGELYDAARGAAASAPADPPRDDAPFLLLTSSGTTGSPKAYLKTRAQYAANLEVSCRHLGADAGAATFAPGPLSFSLTLYALFEALSTGGRLHVADRLDELWLTSRVRDEQPTRLVAVPAALHALADAADRHPGRYDSLDLIVAGGGTVSADLRARLSTAVPAAHVIGYFGAGELGFIGDSRASYATIRLYPGVEARVRDDDGRDLPPGGLGTLWVRSGSCSDRYLPATATMRLRDADGWATVHDLGRLHSRDFEFAGRRGDVVTTGGHTVALDAVEHAFDAMPGLGAVCAIAEPHERLGSVIGLVVESDGTPCERESLQEWARVHLAAASVPRRWYVVPELPRTGGGKIRRAAAAALALETGRPL